MSAKITYTVTLPDGRTATRKSARTYTHAVAVLFGETRETAKWGVYGFNGREELAVKEANKLRQTIGRVWSSGTTDYEVAILPVSAS